MAPRRTPPRASALLADLNPEQRRAVTHAEGPLLIVAGAGTGKTTVITRRIAWLILECGIATDGVLALTFTEKAAGELEERVDRLLPYGYVDLWTSTFHGFCDRILQRHALDIGIPNEYTLLDPTHAWLLLRRHLDDLPLDYYRPRGNPTKFLHALVSHFSRCKDEAVTPEEYLAYARQRRLDGDGEDMGVGGLDPTEANRINELANVYHAYQQLLLREGCLDFGDLLLATLRLFRERPVILDRYRRQFAYLLVDEFQDTNWAQYEIVKLLAAPRNNLTVVGDDDQSIYRWRGAAMSNILHFREDYPSATHIAITTNYRATQNLLDAAYRCVRENNPNRLEVTLNLSKQLTAASAGAGVIEILHARDGQEEARMVVEKIIEWKRRGGLHARPRAGVNPAPTVGEVSWGDIAILVRANRQAEQFLPVLDAAGIPYLTSTSRGLYRTPIILDLLAYLTVLEDWNQSVALYRVCSIPVFGFTSDELLLLTNWAGRKAQPLHAVLRNAVVVPDVAPATVQKVHRVLELLGRHATLARRAPIREVILAVLTDSGILAACTREEDAAGHEAVGILNQFWKRVEAFEASTSEATLRAFMEAMNLEREAGEEGTLPMDPNAGPDAVRVLTVHAAKGLEFRYVCIVHLVEQRFPSTDRGEPIELPTELTKVILPEGDLHLEEERRLFYVALTRAKEGIFLSYADDYGGMRARKPSRFLAELGIELPAASHQPQAERIVRAQPMRGAGSGNREAGNVAPPAHALPSKLSFTQLRAYQTCPWQYHYAHVLRIPLRGRWTLSFGQTMHVTLQRFFERVRATGMTEQRSLFRGEVENAVGGGPPPLAELLQMYHDVWIDDWYESQAQMDEYRAAGRRILEALYAQYTASGWPHVRATEQPFTLKVGAHRVVGKIDRVDDLPSGRVAIVDYKTGKPKERLTADDKLQLLIYQVAATQVLGVEPEVLSYYYLENNTAVSFLGTAGELEELAATIQAIGERIANSAFTPTPGQHCRTCDFRTICPYAQG